MSEGIVSAYLGALKSLEGDSPKPLLKRAAVNAEDLEPEPDVSPERLLEHLRAVDANDPLLRRLGLALFDWDNRPDGESWTAGTPQNSPERRARTYGLLGLDVEVAESVDERFPPMQETSTIIRADDDDFEAWRLIQNVDNSPILVPSAKRLGKFATRRST